MSTTHLEITAAPIALSDGEILAMIEELQQIQKTHYWKDPAWQTADELLDPLFAEMAARHPVK